VAQVHRQELLKAIKAASLFSRQGLFDVYLEIFSDGKVTISSADTGTGAHTTTIQAKEPTEPNKVTLNFKYVGDGLSVMPVDDVKVQMIDGMNPVVLVPADMEGFQYVVMPIRQ
jgi:DNA polymerase III sliding clamp (beta) subunit (PCNA family)